MQKLPAIQKCKGGTVDRWKDGPTDTARCKVACPQLKTFGENGKELEESEYRWENQISDELVVNRKKAQSNNNNDKDCQV